MYGENTLKTFKDYRMTRVTFGVSASPFLATKALQQAATIERDKYPQASEAVLQAFYVDDYITGAADINAAIQLRKQLQHMLDPYDLVLRKWRSSSSDVMKTIPTELHEKQMDSESFRQQQYLKTLGIHWDDREDQFYVSTSALRLPAVVTKRLLTSDIAQTFDVLGWFTPVTLVMKVLIQKLWEHTVDWDDSVSPHIQEEWS